MTPAVFVIAEAGVNHDGDAAQAARLVDAAAEAGADAVKFQAFVPEDLVTADAAKAAYQEETTGTGEGQLDMLRRLALPHEVFRSLKARAEARGLRFLCTPFDAGSLDFLAADLGLDTLKIPSGEITNGPLLLRAARTGCRIVLSTGMSTLDDVARALGVLAFGYTSDDGPSTAAFDRASASAEGRKALGEKVVLLHCTTEYPAPPTDVNLKAMDTLATAFGLPVGLSDHTEGIAVAIAAAARGAVMIEKHFTLDRTLPGPDHRASLEPEGLAALVDGVRMVGRALGDGAKGPAPSERGNMGVVRKSLVALTDIPAGTPLDEGNMGAKRPGNGISPMEAWDWFGRPAPRAFRAGEQIAP